MKNNNTGKSLKSRTKAGFAIAAVLVIVLIILVVFFYYHGPSQKTIPSIQQENDIHVFSSPTLSFNFTNDFLLANSTQELSSYVNSARLFLLYNGSQNNSIAITLVQNRTNGSMSEAYTLLRQEFNDSNYFFKNISISGYSGVEVLSTKPSISYVTVFIDGPSGYYTGLFIDDNYTGYSSIISAGLNKILSTVSFNYSSYLK